MKKINKKSIKISEAGSRAKLYTPKHSFVIIQINDKHLYLASEHYKKSPKTQSFYEQQNIQENIDLTEIPHGGERDKPQLTMPLFLEAACRIDEYFKTNNKVLINCTHGRSRSGSVIALYLMEYCGLSAKDAIEVVTRALEKRGYTGGIDIKGSYHGSYGDWIRNHEKQKLANRNLKLYTQNKIKPIKNKENIKPANQSPRRSSRLFADSVFTKQNLDNNRPKVKTLSF